MCAFKLNLRHLEREDTQHSFKMSSAVTSKKHHYNSYYYNFHHFRWKKHQDSKSAAGKEAHKPFKHYYYACYKPTEQRKHKRFRPQKAAPIMTFGGLEGFRNRVGEEGEGQKKIGGK